MHYLGNGKSLGRSYSEIINDMNNPPKEERTGEEIKKSIKDGFNALIKKGGKNQNGFDETGSNAVT